MLASRAPGRWTAARSRWWPRSAWRAGGGGWLVEGVGLVGVWEARGGGGGRLGGGAGGRGYEGTLCIM